MKPKRLFIRGERIQLKKRTDANDYRYLNYKSITTDCILECFDEDANYVYFKVHRQDEPLDFVELKQNDLIFITRQRLMNELIYKKVY